MKSLKTLAILCSLLLSSSFTFAQTPGEDDMMKAWQDHMAVTEHHQWFNHMAGEWSYVNRHWMGPDQEPAESEGISIKTLVLGGRYLEEKSKGKSMGIPFEGLGLLAYDNHSQQYLMNWADSFGTAFMTGTGERDGDRLTYELSYPNIMGEGEDHMRMEFLVVSKDKHIMTMYSDMGEGEFKMMEIVYTRVK